MDHKIEYAEKCDASWQVHYIDGTKYVINCRVCGTTVAGGGTPKCLLHKTALLPAVWVDHKGREVVINSMSDYWLNNIRKMFKGEGRQKIQPIMDEIKRRKKKRSLPKW
jgi:protein gp37